MRWVFNLPKALKKKNTQKQTKLKLVIFFLNSEVKTKYNKSIVQKVEPRVGNKPTR